MTTEITLSQKAADIMNSPALTITGTATLAETAWIMIRQNISALPVLDAQHLFVGMLTKRVLQAKLAFIRPVSSRTVRDDFVRPN